MQTDQTHTKPLALVTAAAKGLGFELAKQFAENGYDLIIVAEDTDIVDAAMTLRNHGTEVEFLQVNLSEPKNVKMLYEFIRFRMRPLDVAILHLGNGVRGDFVKETSIKDELRLISRNIISMVCLTKFLLKDMVGRGEGHILFTSSHRGIGKTSFKAVYYATKAFIQSFSESIKEELGPSNIKVTALEPDQLVDQDIKNFLLMA